jgi:hypothetical protein
MKETPDNSQQTSPFTVKITTFELEFEYLWKSKPEKFFTSIIIFHRLVPWVLFAITT